MDGREHRIYQEAAALWLALHGEPPPADADGGMVLDLLLGSLPEAGYDRLANPFLRPANVAFPKRA